MCGLDRVSCFDKDVKISLRTLSPIVKLIVTSISCCVLTFNSLTSGPIVVPCHVHNYIRRL